MIEMWPWSGEVDDLKTTAFNYYTATAKTV
jgi:hypothetical protein